MEFSNKKNLVSKVQKALNLDADGIDNFVIGLKDLGIWHNSVMWLMRSQYNVGYSRINNGRITIIASCA
jgi:hypothetical protein